MYKLVAIAVLICVARFFIEPTPLSASGSYQAVAHLFVGGLFAAAWAFKSQWVGNDYRLSTDRRKLTLRLFWLGIGMSLLEVFAAVITRL